MDESTKQHLISAGRNDLVEVFELNESGWAGITTDTGMIVDRRKFPKAIPAPKNSMLGIPEPKKLPINAAYDYQSDEESCILLGVRGNKVRWIKEACVTADRARELIFEHNKGITKQQE